MIPSHEDVAERDELDLTVITKDSEANVYVLYPSDASNEEIKTMWIGCAESDLLRATDRQ